MGNYWKWVVFFLLITILFNTDGSSIEEAFACSGPGSGTLEELIEYAETIVFGTMLDVDDANQNGRFLVEEYWKGSGPQHIIINQNTTRRVRYLRDRIYGGDCDSFDTHLRAGERRVMFLYRNFDGSYGTSSTVYHHDYAFPTPDATSELDWWTGRDPLPFTEFRDLVTSEADTEVQAPEYDAPILPAPILVQTEANSLYMIPIDDPEPILLAEDAEYVFTGQEEIAIATEDEFFVIPRHDHCLFCTRQTDGERHPVTPRPDITQCERTTCFAFAPTYNFVAYTLDADTILMCEHYSYCYLDDESMQIGEVSGQAFSFSSTGTHIAVWNEDHIDIYVLRAVSRLFIKPTDPMLRAVINLDDASDLLGQGVWSPDGTWFVFSDADGLWRLDLTQPEADRELLIPSDADGVPIVDGYSGGGRYIFIAQGDAPYIYDTRAATILPDAIISPNDVHFLEPAQELLLDGNRPRLFWRNNDFALAMPKTFNGDDYYLADGWIDLDYLPLNGESYLSAGNGIDFDYEPVSDSPLVQNDAHLITAILGTFPLEVAQFTMGEPIQSARWLPAIYYQE